MRSVLLFVVSAASLLSCAPAPLYPAPPSMGSGPRANACDAQVVREALPVEENDERILFAAGAVQLGELVLDDDARTSSYGESQIAASRATCMGGTHFRLVRRRPARAERFPPTFVVYRVASGRMRVLPSELKPVALR